jgi:hypothetical protein
MSDDLSIFAAAAAAGLAQSNGKRRQRRKTEHPVAEKPVVNDIVAQIAALSFISLDHAVAYVRPLVADATKPTKQRIRLLWAAAMRARDIGGTTATMKAFMALAVETGLINSYGQWTGADVRDTQRRYGAEDVAHVLQWAMRGMNPFKEPLRPP